MKKHKKYKKPKSYLKEGTIMTKKIIIKELKNRFFSAEQKLHNGYTNEIYCRDDELKAIKKFIK